MPEMNRHPNKESIISRHIPKNLGRSNLATYFCFLNEDVGTYRELDRKVGGMVAAIVMLKRRMHFIPARKKNRSRSFSSRTLRPFLLSQAIANDSLIYYANFARVRNGAIARTEELVSSSVSYL